MNNRILWLRNRWMGLTDNPLGVAIKLAVIAAILICGSRMVWPVLL